jgi:predicted metallo-beta-lactamase superfamily hydrolase
MNIIPLAAESMGCQSMATFVETKNLSILIDPGANLESLRYGLPPHPLEQWCLKKLRDRIQLFSKSANIIIITHYDYAHFNPTSLKLYYGKVLFLKNPTQQINTYNRKLAFDFIQKIKGKSKDIKYIDGRKLQMGKLTITFSKPLGLINDNKSDFIIQVAIQEKEDIFLFTSDIYGLAQKEALDFIIEQSPNFLYLDGPITYLHNNTQRLQILEKTLWNMEQLFKKIKIQNIILDHHLLRDLQWKEKIHPLFESAKKYNIKIQTASEYRGEDNNLLEARRDQLYKDDN